VLAKDDTNLNIKFSSHVAFLEDHPSAMLTAIIF